MSDDERSSSGCLGLTVGGLLSLTLVLPIGFVGCMSITQQSHDSGSSCGISVSGGGETIQVPNGWGSLVEDAAKEAGLPTQLVAGLLKQESSWNPNATSPVGAEGLGQFMPETWEEYGEGGDPRNPEDAIPAVGRYLKALKKQVEPYGDGNEGEVVKLTLAAYNAGPGAVEEHGGIPPYDETQNYVKTIISSGSEFSSSCESPEGGKSWDGDLGDGEWTTPLPGSSMTGAGAFGPRDIAGYPAWANDHKGVDFATNQASHGLGGTVVSPTDLMVLDIYEPDGCVQTRLLGKNDDPHFGMSFCHLGEIDVKAGDRLGRGDIIGTEGNQGESLGNSQGGQGFITHLHFEIYPPDTPEAEMKVPGNNSAIDPEPILKEKGAWP